MSMPLKKDRYLIPDLVLLDSEADLTTMIGSEEDFALFFHQSRLEIQKSEFICTLARSDSVEGARKAIDYIQKKYADATHNCYAFQVKEPKSTSHIGYSDDNEPHGTAGKPMLTSLLYADVGEIVAIVTRYFGGVKLGTGGLVRAYQGAVAKALDELQTIEKVERIEIVVELDYSNTSHLHRILSDFDCKIIAEKYDEKGQFTLELPEDKRTDFIKKLQDLTSSICLI